MLGYFTVKPLVSGHPPDLGRVSAYRRLKDYKHHGSGGWGGCQSCLLNDMVRFKISKTKNPW